MGSQDRGRAAKIAGVAGIALLVAACGSSPSNSAAKSKIAAAAHSSRSPSAGTRSGNASTSTTPPKAGSGTAILKPEHTSLGNFLANGQGFTLYGFTRDSSTASACTGACARVWHPLTGTPQVATGVSLSGTLGTITRSGGVRQATFDGHPLYTFKEDKVPGEIKGNGEPEFGGRWLAIPVHATVPVAPSPSASASASATISATPSAPRSHRSGGAGP